MHPQGDHLEHRALYTAALDHLLTVVKVSASDYLTTPSYLSACTHAHLYMNLADPHDSLPHTSMVSICSIDL